MLDVLNLLNTLEVYSCLYMYIHDENYNIY